MKYIKYSIVLVLVMGCFEVISTFATTYNYANISISSLHGTWKSSQKRKYLEYKVQFFTNNGARDSLGNEYIMAGRTQSMYDSVGYSSWKNASKNTSNSWENENLTPGEYKLELKAKEYNALSLSFNGSWTID